MKHTSRATFLLTVCLISSTAWATTWYVKGVSGSDSNNCTSATTACKTIGHAISLAASGDSIKVAAATYPEHLTIGISLTVLGASASTTVIDGGFTGTVVTISSGTQVTLSGVTIRNGSARYAGGISNRGTLMLIASRVSGNRASLPPGPTGSTGGGGVYNYATLIINNSTLTKNMASASCYEGCDAYGGGIANAISATLIINNSTLSGNVAGAGCSRYCSAYGGGIYTGGTVTISNSTLSGNAADFPGGGGGIGGTATLQNTIVANSPSGGNCAGAMISKGYNLSSDNTCNFNATGDLNNTDPMLGPLQNNGGPTQTMALPSGSPAVDGGNPNGCTDGVGNLLKTDQRGKPRPDTEDSGGCDIGAYERQSD
jgi:hypothetical protein